jgi:predicted acetyltransferase
MIMFVARFRSAGGAAHAIFCEISTAFAVAYALENDKNCIEFKCFYTDCQVTEIPGTLFKPSKLVTKFCFTEN